MPASFEAKRQPLIQHALHLLLPAFTRQKARIVEADRRRLPTAGQPLQHLRRKISQPQLAADMSLGQSDGLCQFLDRAELASVQAMM